MKELHIKFHIATPKQSKEQRLEHIKNYVFTRIMKSIAYSIEVNGNKFNFLLQRLFKEYRSLLEFSLVIYELTQDKSDWEAVLHNLHTSFSALAALIEQPDSSKAITVAGVTGKLDPHYPPPKYSGWSIRLFESISMRRDDLVAILLKYDPETAAQLEPEFADLARFQVNYIKEMLDKNGDHDRLFTQLNEVFSSDLQPHAQARVVPFYYLAKEDEDGFEQAIIRATQAHRSACKANGVPIDPTQTRFPSAIIAAASLGYDRHGWTLKHKNDYLPEWWIYNRFTPENEGAG
ncbi:Imm49 family immunity protein [Alteromonas sp. ASW11-130]|uniref:Imm49 family immunity protein n=1 Tax=Alteromonas sp. ASW11-130 TaxID=3015775 RepID=UPI00224258B6|nr:Imm49 family immunity protein [Alteromonas sp. ASW11-130]MCW8091746.1 immunity 49 family protein [Alteromonas sp. ASW11-130]